MNMNFTKTFFWSLALLFDEIWGRAANLPINEIILQFLENVRLILKVG